MIQSITPCIVMSGIAREAIHFYEKVFDAQILHVQTYGDMPIPCPDALKELVANAILRIGQSQLMLFDAPSQPAEDHNKVTNSELPDVRQSGSSTVTINISISNVEKTKQIFAALQEGGKVIAPLESVPFSPAFGTVTDKFGVTFIVVTQQ